MNIILQQNGKYYVKDEENSIWLYLAFPFKLKCDKT